MHTLTERERDALERGLARWYRGRLIPIMRGAEDPPADPPADPPTDPPADPPKTFTQAELDRIVQERLARAKTTPPVDYEDIKAKAAKYDEAEQANKTELEKANERAAKAEIDKAAAEERAQTTLVNSAIITAAAGKLADPSDAVALIDRATLELDTAGNPTNVADAVDALLKAKPHLAAGSNGNGGADLGARGNGVQQLTREQLTQMSPDEIAKAESEGRLAGLLSGK